MSKVDIFRHFNMATTDGKKTGGRTKGTPNSETKKIRECFALLVSNNLEQLEADLISLRPKDRVEAIISLAKFCVPTLKAVEYEDTTPKDKQSKFSFVFVNKSELTDED